VTRNWFRFQDDSSRVWKSIGDLSFSITIELERPRLIVTGPQPTSFGFRYPVIDRTERGRSNPRASSGICVSVFANWLHMGYGNPRWLSTRRLASYHRNPKSLNKAQFSTGSSTHN